MVSVLWSTLISICVHQVVELLIPELQRRELFWDDYPEVPQPAGSTKKVGITAREGLAGKVGQKHLDPSHYGYQFKWKQNEGKTNGTNAAHVDK